MNGFADKVKAVVTMVAGLVVGLFMAKPAMAADVATRFWWIAPISSVIALIMAFVFIAS